MFEGLLLLAAGLTFALMLLAAIAGYIGEALSNYLERRRLRRDGRAYARAARESLRVSGEGCIWNQPKGGRNADF